MRLLLSLLLLFLLSTVCNGRHYELKKYDDVVQELHALAKAYPDMVEVFTAQDRYGLPSPGFCGKLTPCKQWVLHITDFATLADDIDRPEVFLSGCLHGESTYISLTLCIQIDATGFDAALLT